MVVKTMTFLALLVLGTETITAQAQTGRYEVNETVLSSTKIYPNPFTDVKVAATFIAPSRKKLTAYAFHDGGRTWRVRIAPDEVGVWSYVTSSSDTSDTGLHGRRGSFICIASTNKGFIKVDPTRKYYFSYSDGKPFYGIGDTVYGIINGVSDVQRSNYLKTRQSQGFNFVRFLLAGSWSTYRDVALPVPPQDGWAFGGTPSAPNYDVLNTRYFQRLDRIIAEFKAHAMHAEFIVMDGGGDPTNHILSNATRQDTWARYVVSRYAAYTTVFLWTAMNEYERYPDGKYRYDGASDDTWAKSMGALFHSVDPHKHPTTVHHMGTAPQWDANLHGEKAVESGVIGSRFGASPDLDVITHQHNGYGGARWTAGTPGYWDGPAAGTGTAILADRKYHKPVINTENGYQVRAGHPNDANQQSHGTEKVRRGAWRIFVSGGAAYAAGFLGTFDGTDRDTSADSRTGRRQSDPFVVESAGWASQVKSYRDFIAKTDFRSMDPAQGLVNTPNLCLAKAGREYVIFAPLGGAVSLDLSSVAGTFAVEWLNPRTGSYHGQTSVSGGSRRMFGAPDSNDWILHLTRTGAGN